MKLQTLVDVPESTVGISYGDRILVIGSCFADNIGAKMKNAGFDVMVNPFGTLYNPVSIFSAISRLESGERFTERDCVRMGAGSDLWCSFSHHTSFARRSREDFLEHANSSLAEAHEFFRKCGKVIVTLGTAWCYRSCDTGETVSNCLKIPAARFTRYRLSVEHCRSVLSSIVETGQGRKFIFTVSPVRHFKDGAHGNQISKSTLLLAVDGTLAAYPERCDYFPAYEIVCDELRDYRFYADDMLHPSELTVSYLWERFVESCLPSGEKEKLLGNEKLFRRSQHRSMH